MDFRTPAVRTPFKTVVSDGLRTFGYLVGLSTICIASRLPQLRSPNLLVDGDESVLGLMAKHVAQGKEFPIFFYGQHYALATIEAGAGALGFLISGVNAASLKLSMLVLWTIGVLFSFLALSKILNVRRGFWITTVLVLNPAWAAWSMKAGGGYITSFTATAMLAWLLVQPRQRETILRWLVAGALTAIIYLSQPLWLPGVLPIVFVMLASRRRLSWAAGYGAVACAAILLVKFATPAIVDSWGGPPIGNPNLLGSISRVGRQLYVYLTGSYYLQWAIDPPGPATIGFAVVWCAVLPALVLTQIYRLAARRYCLASHVLFVSACSTLVAEWLLLSARDARYLLPLGALLVPLAGIELADLMDHKVLPRSVVLGITAAMLVLGGLSMREFSEFNYLWKNSPNRWTEARRLQQVLGYLQVKDVTRVFSMNGLLDSQLMFYSNEQVLARWTYPISRYPAYSTTVDRALASGEKVAVVGYTHASGAPGCWDVPICTGGLEGMIADPDSIFTVDGKYFVYVGADRELLRRLGFRFWD